MSFSTVSVVGSGPVGCGVALACAAEGIPVTLVRAQAGDPDAIRDRLTRRLALAVEAGAIAASEAADRLTRIEIARDLRHVAGSDLVIDATHLAPRARRALLATLESRMSGGAVLATCAPWEELSSIAQALGRPDQLVGMRFHVPAASEARVELAVLPETAPGAIAAARAFCASIGKDALESKSDPPRIGYREWDSLPPPAPRVADAAE